MSFVKSYEKKSQVKRDLVVSLALFFATLSIVIVLL